MNKIYCSSTDEWFQEKEIRYNTYLQLQIASKIAWEAFEKNKSQENLKKSIALIKELDIAYLNYKDNVLFVDNIVD